MQMSTAVKNLETPPAKVRELLTRQDKARCTLNRTPLVTMLDFHISKAQPITRRGELSNLVCGRPVKSELIELLSEIGKKLFFSWKHMVSQTILWCDELRPWLSHVDFVVIISLCEISKLFACKSLKRPLADDHLGQFIWRHLFYGIYPIQAAKSPNPAFDGF